MLFLLGSLISLITYDTMHKILLHWIVYIKIRIFITKVRIYRFLREIFSRLFIYHLIYIRIIIHTRRSINGHVILRYALWVRTVLAVKRRCIHLVIMLIHVLCVRIIVLTLIRSLLVNRRVRMALAHSVNLFRSHEIILSLVGWAWALICSPI